MGKGKGKSQRPGRRRDRNQYADWYRNREHTHLVRTDIAGNSELKGKLDSAQALGTKLEAANLRMKDKISALDKSLDDSNNENEKLKTSTSKLKDKVKELTLMLDNKRSILPPCHSLLLLSGDKIPFFCTRAQAIISGVHLHSRRDPFTSYFR